MATQKQVEANRRNAQNSTGPRTAAGKARSAMNAYKTGIDAKTAVLPGREDTDAFEALKAEYHDFHQPRTPEARRFCDQLALHEWFDHRLTRLQVALFEHEFQTADPPIDDCALGQAFSNGSAKFARLQRHMTANDRAYLQCLNKLEDIERQYPPDPKPEPVETKPQTPQLASFRQNGAASEASHLPQPPVPWK